MNTKDNMNRNRIFSVGVCAALLSLAACADVITVDTKPVVDGKLDDACWQQAKWETSGFHPLAGSAAQTVDDQTEFAIVADAETVYVAVRCHEHLMDKLRAKPHSRAVVVCDDVEVFLSPSGNPMNIYQFCVSAPHNVGFPVYHIEGGLTHPDPYAPFWKHAVALEDAAWTLELEIPLSAFYNTRAEDFQSEWVLNVCRVDQTRDAKRAQFTSWGPLERRFIEPENFPRMKGFPKAKAANDVAVKSAVVEIAEKRDGKLCGEMTVYAYVGVPGAFRFTSPYAESRDVTLKAGENTFTVPCLFEKNARYKVPLVLTRMSDGKVFGRDYPVPVDYDALRIAFTSPGYRTDFYPGQDCSRIAGRVKTALRDPVRVVLEGPGIPRVEKTLAADGAFAFDTPGFEPGAAKLVFACGAETRTRTVRRNAKTGRRMAWVENGHIVVDGKPVLRRTLYGYGYRCSEPYMVRITPEALHLTPEAGYVGLEFGRLVKGSEQREGGNDDPPSKEVLDAIDRSMDALKDREFAGYYLCDEPECRSISPVYLRYVYEHVRERDPNHLCFVCTRDPARFLECADVIEPHPYLCPTWGKDGSRLYGEPLERYGKYFEPMAGRADKVAGNVSFAFTYRYGSVACDDATFDEYVASIWAALCEGVKSFHPFIADSINDNWGVFHGVEYTFAQMEELQPWLLDARRTRLARTGDYVLTKWEKDGETLVAAVNFQPRPRRIRLSGLKADLVEFRGDRTFRAEWGSDERWIRLEPFETIVASTKAIPSKYPSLKEIRARIERDEHARTHRDNQIFGRDLELEFSEGTRQKLCDGILDQQAALLRGGNPRFELGFPREPIIFSSLRIYGANVDKATVEICLNGVWSAPAVAEAKNDASVWLRTVTFAEKVTADRVRIQFHKDKAEIFELEFPHCLRFE